MADLYRYRPRRFWIARLLATFLGILGAHRFYLGRPFTGLLLLVSAGGGLVWWIMDMFRLRAMVAQYNLEERHREKNRLPPQGLGFLPPLEELDLSSPPAWSALRSGRGRVFGSGVLLALMGISLGAISGATGIHEPVLVLTLFIAISLLAARWRGLAGVPLLRGLVRWVHRLRLYYHTIDPGNVWMLAARPVLGVVLAVWQPKLRVEVRLYLQLGVVFAVGMAAADLLEFLDRDGFWRAFGLLVAEFAQTLVYTYIFVAPVGALLTTQLLLTRRDRVVWILSTINLLCIYTGWSLVMR